MAVESSKKTGSVTVDGSLASIYGLVYSFLAKHSHTKAAEAVKKAARDVVVLKADVAPAGPFLEDIVKQWKILTLILIPIHQRTLQALHLQQMKERRFQRQ
ncbi:hypothetical protein BKA93DRAFT_67776 [Sparassis latifolia]